MPPGVWRSAVGVKGRSRSDKKKSGQLIVKQRYGEIYANDESDAILIGLYGIRQDFSKPEMMSWG